MTKFLDFYINLNHIFTVSEKETCFPLIYKITETYRRTYVELKSPNYQTWQQAANKEQDPFFKTALTLAANRPLDDEVAYDLYVEQIEEKLLELIHTDERGQDLLNKLIIYHGILCILRCRGRNLTAFCLYAILGEKYLIQAIENPRAFNNPIPVYEINSVKEYLERAKNRPQEIILTSDYKNSDVAGKLDYLFHRMTDHDVQYLLKEIAPYDLAVILKANDCYIETYEKILNNMSFRMGQCAIDDLEYTNFPEYAKIEESKSNLVKIIQRLRKDGWLDMGETKKK